MLVLNILLLHHALHSTVKAAAIDNVPRYALPAGEGSLALRDSPPTKDLELYIERSTTTELEARSSTTGVGALVYHRQPLPNEVILAGITAVKEIFIATCTARVLVCFILCAAVLIGGIQDLNSLYIQSTKNYSPSNQGGTFVPTRSIDGPEFNYHESFQPTTDCGLQCQLISKIPEGEWTHTGNATHNGYIHQIHHFHNRSTMGIRAYQRNGPVLSKRNPYDQEDYESVVGDFYWDCGTTATYDSFHSTSSEIQSAGNDVGTYMVDNIYIAACVDFDDNTGLLEDGVMAMGWDNDPYVWDSQTDLDAAISECNIGNLYHGGIEPGYPEIDDV